MDDAQRVALDGVRRHHCRRAALPHVEPGDVVRIAQDSTARAVAWPASFKWAGGLAGSVSTGSGAIDVLALTTFDNGTTWDATLAKAFA